MKKYFFTIIIFLFSCTPTEPVETYDDNAILQLLLNMADSAAVGFLKNEFDIDGNGTLDCMELPNTLDDTVTCTMENDRFTKIKLSNMGLSGTIPESLGDLTELTHLGLKNNNLTGEVPASIGNLTNLTQLNLAYNTLSGSIPDTINNLQKLVRLNISNNQFTGSIPNSIGNLTALEYLYLKDNNLSGTIPDEICSIYKYNYTFDLSGNQFCPPLPDCLDDPDKFNILNCDTSCGDEYDFLDGYCYSKTDLSVLTSLIINQDSLNMDLDDNSNGKIEPLELGFQKWSAGRIEKLDCHWADTVSCNLSITIPDNIIELDSLKHLNLQENNLSGKLPDGFGNLISLEYLNLQNNNLIGGIPESIIDLPKLVTLNLISNKMGCYEFDFSEDTCRVHCNDDDIDVCSGNVPENFCKIETIENLDLSNNMLCPCYPICIENDIGTQETSGCAPCDNGYTQICDASPESVTILEGDSLCFKSDNLDVLNAFIDSSLSNLKDNLDISMLSDTTSSIDELEPLELGEQIWANGQLIYLDASDRGLSGGIPQNINSLDTLFFLSLYNNHLSGILPESIYNITDLSTLHLNGNNLSGEISLSICDITNLNWESDGTQFLPSKSYLFDNQFCPGETGYPVCIEPYVGEQDTEECNSP